jgi:predicted hotdog family 3-hydroxylacyl-ACP dehydratase
MDGPHPPPWPPPGLAQHTLALPQGHPAFVGHFPGEPLFPGVAQLWMAHTLAVGRYGAAYPRALRRVKFRAPIQPDRRLDCDLLPTGREGEVEWELRDRGNVREPAIGRDGTTAADGFMVISREPGPEPRRDPIESMLPQRGPALLVTDALRIAHAGDELSWFRGRVPEASFLARDGMVSAFAAIEFAGQAAAALHEMRKPATEPVRLLGGLLVGVREATFAAPGFALDAELLAGVRSSSRGGFFTVHAEVRTALAGDVRELLAVELQILVR